MTRKTVPFGNAEGFGFFKTIAFPNEPIYGRGSEIFEDYEVEVIEIMARNVRVAGFEVDFEMCGIGTRRTENAFGPRREVDIRNFAGESVESVCPASVAVFLDTFTIGRPIRFGKVFFKFADRYDALRSDSDVFSKKFVGNRFGLPGLAYESPEQPAVHGFKKRLFGYPGLRGIVFKMEVVVIKIGEEEAGTVRYENVRNISGTRMSGVDFLEFRERGVGTVYRILLSVPVSFVDEESYRTVFVSKIGRAELVNFRR